MLGSTLLASLPGGCTHGRESDAGVAVVKPWVVVVAPVLNLSPSDEFDSLKITDILASELQSFPNISVMPVNLSLAALARAGRSLVETPAQALELAREFGADATLVAAVTEYDPYDPPAMGLVLQWYEPAQASEQERGFDPVGASRQAAAVRHPDQDLRAEGVGPLLQVQRVFNAASEDVLEEVREFASDREGHASPYAWRKYLKVQELYVRYCCWSAIRTMLSQRNQPPTATDPEETEQ